ncbi:MAG: ribosomal RNA small subunit methyltransferase H [Candidatus Parcubacteria bacterium]|nr:MAG: ribosomal RNA small subunit methyltransferase H [Candidatus Parcubacteria bacterium]
MHTPVLLQESLSFLEPKKNENFIDATFGLGGFSLALCQYLMPNGKILAFEWDPYLFKLGVAKLQNTIMNKNIKIVNKNFRQIKNIVKKENFTHIKGVIFDLGISNWHYQNAKRGFSFQKDEPLDMRINPQEIKITAFDVINYSSFEKLVEIFQEYGEERDSKKIAKAIVSQRKNKKIETSKELAELIVAAKKNKRKKIHPATQVFMALRSFVNQELVNLEVGLKSAYDVLDKGGRIVVISFNGLEDRVIKKVFKTLKYEKKAKIMTKNAVKPTKNEILNNPKARSAKLRAIMKT